MASMFILANALLGGGTERVISQLANDLPPYVDTKLVIINNTERKYPLSSVPIQMGFYYSSHIPEQIYSLWKLIPVVFKYLALLHKHKPSVSLSMLDFDILVNVIACKITKIPIITSVRQNPSAKNIHFIARKLIYVTTILSKIFATKIITNSEGVKNELVVKYGINPEKISVIYNPKNIHEIENLCNEDVSELIFADSVPVIITVGRLFEVKGQWHLLRVFSELRKHTPCKLVICGDGPLHDYLVNLSSELNLGDDVLFLGWCSNPYKYIARSSVFVLSSLSEGQPNALIEAMICGCPVVAADCNYGPREILSDGEFGLLSEKLDAGHYSAHDPLTFAEVDLMNKISLILSNSDLCRSLSINGRERAKIFDYDLIMRRYASEILSCIRPMETQK